MAFRVTEILATLALVASLLGVFPSVAVVRANPGSGLRVLWVLVPVLSAGGIFLLASGRRYATVWGLIGTSCGFVVAAAWGLGLFFAPSTLLLLMAGIAHLVAIRSSWRAALIPAWCFAGASAAFALFFVRVQLLPTPPGVQTTSAPVIVIGTELFAVLVVVLVAMQVALRLAGRRTLR